MARSFVAALVAGSVWATPILAQTTAPATSAAVSAFREDDPAYAALERLHKIMLGRFNAFDASTISRPQLAKLIADLEDEIALAQATPIRGTKLAHPLGGVALVGLASVHFGTGEYIKASDRAMQAIAALGPFRDIYASSYVGAIALRSYTLNSAGRSTEAMSVLDDGLAFFGTRAGRGLALTESEAVAKSNLEHTYAQILTRLGQLDRALGYQRRCLATRIGALGEISAPAIASRYELALSLFRTGAIDAAEVEGRRALELAQQHLAPNDMTYSRSIEALALVLGNSGKRVEAADYMRRSLELKRAALGVDHLNYAAGLHNLGENELSRERYAEAHGTLREAALRYRNAGGVKSFDALRSESLHALASFAESGPGAGDELETSFAALRASDPKERQQSLRLVPQLILARWDVGKKGAARDLALQYRTELAGFDRAVPSALAEADALMSFTDRTGTDWRTKAVGAGRTAVDAVRNEGWLATDGELSMRARATLDLALRIAVDTDDAALGLNAMTILAGSRIAQANRLVARRMGEDDPALAPRLRELQDFTQTYRSSDGQYLRALGSGVNLPEARAARDAARQAAETARAAVRREFPRWIEARGEAATDLPALQAGLAGHEAVLGVIPAFDGLYVLTLTRQTASIRRARASRKEIYDLVERVRNSLPTGAYDVAAAAELRAQFLPPETAAQLKSIKALRIVASGPVSGLPFAALLDRPVAQIDSRAPWLIRRFALRLSPDFAAPVRRPSTQSRASANRFLGVGDPTPFGPRVQTAESRTVGPAARYYRGVSADTMALGELPPLPASATELAEVAEELGSAQATLLSGDEASEARLRSIDLTGYDVILFATHGLVSGEMEGVVEPALVLAKPQAGAATDGLLTATEVSELRLDADWVVLSACNTAAGGSAGASALSGLAQAFRYAGARALLVSNWPVRDDIAARLTVASIRHSRTGMSLDFAVRKAVLGLLKSAGGRDAADPFVWAPFVLVD